MGANMNLKLIKQMAVLSAIWGGIFGVISLIPIIGGLAFLVMFLGLSAILIVMMKQRDMIGIFNMKEGAIWGAVIGFVAFIAFAVVYTPLSIIVGLIFKSYAYGFLKTFFTSIIGFIVMVMLMFFIALLSALMNSFAGVVTAYVYELLSGFKKQANENVDFEIK